jgi:hypothetical protein
MRNEQAFVNRAILCDVKKESFIILEASLTLQNFHFSLEFVFSMGSEGSKPKEDGVEKTKCQVSFGNIGACMYVCVHVCVNSKCMLQNVCM